MALEDELIVACADGNADEVDRILRKKKFLFFPAVDVNGRDADGSTPMFVATQFGQLEAMRALLNHGADINGRNQLDITPLMLSAAMGRADLVQALLNHDDEIRPKADPNLKMKSGSTALYLAAEKGDEDCVQMLLEHGAEVDSSIEDGSTALYIAAQNGFDQIVRLLLNAGANIDVQLSDNSTPLFSAAHRGHAAVVKELVSHGAATDILLTSGQTLSELASTDEIRSMVQETPLPGDPVDTQEDSAFSGDAGTFVDPRDDNEYRWVKLGKKVWMADNLRFKVDGYCWPSEDIGTHGYFYGRESIPQACPPGWRAPEKSDLEELITLFGGEDEAYGPLTSAGASGFDAVAAGRRYDDGQIANTDTAYFWALKSDGDGLAWFLKLTGYDEQAVVSETWDEGLKLNMGTSVRCIKQ